MRKYFCVSGFMQWDIFRKASSSEIQDSLIATCNYKEHAVMIVDALNAQELAQFNERKEQRKSRPEPLIYLIVLVAWCKVADLWNKRKKLWKL